MNNIRQRLFVPLVYLSVFLLPWQTKYIIEQKLLDGQPWEYGVIAVFLVEMLVVATFFIGQRFRISRTNRTPVICIGFVLLVAAISVLFSKNPDLSFFAWIHLVISGMLFMTLLDRRVQKKQVMFAFVVGLVVPSLLALSQVITGYSPPSTILGLAEHQASDLGVAVVENDSTRIMRGYGTLSHPNVFGGYVAIGILMAVALSAQRSRGKKIQMVIRKVSLASIPFLSFVLVITFSRSAWLSFLLALLVGGGFLLIKGKIRPSRALPILSIVLISLGVAVAIFHEPVLNRFHTSLPLEQRSIVERQGQYQIFPQVLKQGTIIGVGVGAYTVALHGVQPGYPAYTYQPIHNSALLILSEVGIIGIIFVACWAASVDRINYRAIGKGSQEAIVAIALGTVLIVVVFFDHYLWSSWSGLALMAVVMALTLRLSES